MTSLTLGQIARILQCPPPADPDRRISGMNTLEDATDTELSFLGSDAFLKAFAATRAAAVIVHRKVRLPAEPHCPVLVVDDADLAVARILEATAPPVPRPAAGVDPLARVAPTAQLGEGCAVGPFVQVGQRVRMGRRCIVHSGVQIGDDCVLGDDCQLFANVVLRERITLGSRVTIHAGSVLGTDGFGYRWDGQRHVKIPQVGTVIVEDYVEIGSCVCIDRAKFSATVIGQGSKIDNLVQIGHNVHVGPNCIIVGQAGLAGSVRMGRNVILGGQVAVRDHITIGDNVRAAATAAIAEDVEPNSTISGIPAIPHRQHLREQAAMRRLPHLLVQVRELEEKLAKLTEKQEQRG